VGGFQLLARADDPQAVQRCRQRKGRPHKPLALLASERWLQRHCQINPQELALWQSAAAPIVLLRRKRQSGVADGVAGCSPWLAVMRASSGLQQLVLEHCGGAVVATSANRSGEPIATDAEALGMLADAVLSHTLPIVNPVDDSVVRWAAEGPVVLRLGRGLAPLALEAPPVGEPCLALGAHSKGSVALRLDGHRLLSPDHGDLGSEQALQRLHATTRQWIKRYRRHPLAIASDRHPAYRSTELAQALCDQWSLPLVQIQHHQAHLLAVMAEHGLDGLQLGVAWDGAGHGDDGSLWGGEGLLVSPGGFRRVAQLRCPRPAGTPPRRPGAVDGDLGERLAAASRPTGNLQLLGRLDASGHRAAGALRFNGLSSPHLLEHGSAPGWLGGVARSGCLQQLRSPGGPTLRGGGAALLGTAATARGR
jgi:hydrogenase maturation protein HypF